MATFIINRLKKAQQIADEDHDPAHTRRQGSHANNNTYVESFPDTERGAHVDRPDHAHRGHFFGPVDPFIEQVSGNDLGEDAKEDNHQAAAANQLLEMPLKPFYDNHFRIRGMDSPSL